MTGQPVGSAVRTEAPPVQEQDHHGFCSCKLCGSPLAGKEYARVEQDRWTAIHGDAVHALLNLDPSSCDAIITDPPYGSGGFMARDRKQSAKKKYVRTGAAYADALPDIDGDAIHPAAWTDLMTSFLRSAYSALTDGGLLLTFIDWRNLPELSRLYCESGMVWRGVVVWDKGPSARPMRGGFRNQAEYVLWGSKGKMLEFAGSPYQFGVIHCTTKTNGKLHITEKPLALMRDLVRVVRPDGLVVDPFQGSGTTGVAALQAGLRYIGVESVGAIHETACDRLSQAWATINPDTPA